MSILLIRHGETASNAARIVQTPETPLSPRGSEQARLLGKRLAGSAITRILASDLARAAMTADALQATTDAPLDLDPLLQERNFGDHRGTPYAELGFDLFAADYAPPAGESWDAFHLRVDCAWERVVDLAASEPGDLAVVTHGLVCHSLVMRKLTLPDVAGERGETGIFRFGNTALTVIEACEPWTVSRLACTGHLDTLTADDGEAPSGI